MSRAIASALLLLLLPAACATSPATGSRLPTKDEHMAKCVPVARKFLAMSEAVNWLKEYSNLLDSLDFTKRQRELLLEEALEAVRRVIETGELPQPPRPTAEEIARASKDLERMRQARERDEALEPFVLESLGLMRTPEGELRMTPERKERTRDMILRTPPTVQSRLSAENLEKLARESCETRYLEKARRNLSGAP